MNISGKKGDLVKEACDLLILGVFSKEKEFGGALKAIDEAVDGNISVIAKEESFTGAVGSTLLYRTNGLVPAKRVLLVGLGPKGEFTLEQVRLAAATTFIVAKKMGLKNVVSALLGAGNGALNERDSARIISEGVLLASYTFEGYKKKKAKKHTVESFTIVTHDAKKARLAQKGVDEGIASAMGTIHARMLVDSPAGHMAPKDLVDAARELAKTQKSVRVRVFDREQLKKMGAGGILAVNQGSDHDPYMVHMTYKPTKPSKKKIYIVGKAVTFDSGGLSLKPADYMMAMKCDMAGSAAVIGLFSVIERVAPNVEVHGVFGAVENMPSGRAIRPGDVVIAMNKKSIEILNTDAEGRVTLADTLTYASKQKPDVIIDLATLTGACVVALGNDISGVMSNDDALSTAILDASKQAGEKMWPLPLEKNYKKLIASEIADVKNIGGRYGGAITAGLFLQEFVEEGIPWAHIDIAGPAFNEHASKNVYEGKGATGAGVRTLIEYLRSF